MQRKEIEKVYIKKINELRKHDKAYFNDDKPLISDKNYDKTIFVEEALHRLVEVYYRLGLLDEAKKAAGILGYNYQSGEWYKKSYKVFNKKYKVKEIKKDKKMGLIRRKIKGLFE